MILDRNFSFSFERWKVYCESEKDLHDWGKHLLLITFKQQKISQASFFKTKELILGGKGEEKLLSEMNLKRDKRKRKHFLDLYISQEFWTTL